MPQNPNPNSDKTSNQTTNEPDSWSSPKGTSDQNFVKFDQDDQYPERVERLGQYLSDTTRGDMVNPDVRGGQGNYFPVSPPGEETTGYSDQLDEVLNEAVDYFNNISDGASFSPGIEEDPSDGTYGSGHRLLSEKARDVVSSHIDTNSMDSTSRWFGLGQQRFEPQTGSTRSANRYQVQRSGGNENLDGARPGGTTRFADYKHKSALENKDSVSGDFWETYFDRLSLVGSKITLGATGYKSPSDPKRFGSAPDGIDKDGQLEESDLRGSYAKHDISLTHPGEAFKSDESEQVEESQAKALIEDFKSKRKKLLPRNNKTYGQMNSWNDPFENIGFPIVETDGLEVATQLLEIWAMVVLRVLVTTALLQVASYLVSELLQNVDGEPGLQGVLGINWNRNYYPATPLVQPGSAFFKGSSGFNHPATDVLTRGMDALNRAIASQTGAGGALALGVAQVVGPTVNSTFKMIENEYLNLTIAIQRDLNIYIPRHILSTMANETGYNSPGNIPGVNLLLKGIDIATAYTRAYTAGMGTILAHITVGDYGKSLPFWKNMFRTVIRSKAHMTTNGSTMVAQDSKYEIMLQMCGKDDKIMKFVNYLAMIGDLGTAAGHAGNIAFSENKVPLNQVGNFPTLRTVGGRKRGSKTKSRLSLTETPSLLLLPKNSARIRDNLFTNGLGNSTYGEISGENSLWLKDDKGNIKDQIGNKYQSSKTNRFSPDQVRLIEDQLEGEHMPFYIQDLRTNEIISFHAFLTSLSDSYSADWSAQKGFGRLEAAQIYGGASRSIGVSFTLVSMNPEDFDEMYYKINKLTTLVYPQWSEGTLMDAGDSTFVQPFSQVPTASPLCRLRVGDLFTSNYSNTAMARMMGIGNKDFKYTDPGAPPATASEVTEPDQRSVDEQIKQPRYIEWDHLFGSLLVEQYSLEDIKEIQKRYKDDPMQFTTEWKRTRDGGQGLVVLKPGFFPPKIPFGADDKARYLAFTKLVKDISTPGATGLLSAGSGQFNSGIKGLFNPSVNPILKSFNSSMGRGIAVAITGIGLDWKLGSTPWNLKAGNRAPRMCEVQLSVTPIHDITPGLDHQGINRAPIYKVGSKSKSLTGDVWYNEDDYNSLVQEVEIQHERHLRGEEE